MSAPKRFAVIGNPVRHSLSPRIHSLWYETHGINAHYEAIELPTDNPKADILSLISAGFSGLNVTLPFKIAAFETAKDISSAAKAAGAANTLKLASDGSAAPYWQADNTDWSGFLWSLSRKTSDLPENAVIIGAGGAARAVAYSLKCRNIKAVILNRTLENAETLIGDLEFSDAEAAPLDKLPDFASGSDLVINTISLGHSGGSLDLPPTKTGLFLDISYGKAAEITLAKAKAQGWEIEDGLPMLIGQAADAFKIWFGIEPDREMALKAAREWTGNG